VDFKIKNIDIDGKNVKLQIWDIAGSGRFASIQKTRFEEAHGIVMVYDLTNLESFEDIERHWGQELAKIKLKPSVSIILVGNKSDLQERRIVDTSKAKTFAEEYGAKFVETSAKVGTNVAAMFETVARDIKIALEKNQPSPDSWRETDKGKQKKKCLVM
jgi:Ras-related protein Rab-1A